MRLELGAYNINLCVLDELMNADTNGLFTKVKKPGNHDEYYVLFRDYINVAHAIVTEGGQIRSTMTKEQLRGLFYSLLGECPMDLQAPYSIKQSASKVDKGTVDFVYMLVKSCPYNLPVFVDDTLYFVSTQNGDVILGGKSLGEWQLDDEDLKDWIIKCNPLNFSSCGDLSKHFEHITYEDKGEVKYTVNKRCICLWYGDTYYKALASDEGDWKAVLNVAFHKVPIGDLSYSRFIDMVSRAFRAEVDNNRSVILRFDYGTKVTYIVMKDADGSPVTNAPVAALTSVIADWLIARDKFDELHKLTGILEHELSFKEPAVKCNNVSKSALYALLKLYEYPITFKSGNDYLTVSLEDSRLHVVNRFTNTTQEMDLYRDKSFCYELPELMEVVKQCLPVTDIRLHTFDTVDDFDQKWRSVKLTEQMSSQFELRMGSVGPYLCILCRGAYMITNTSSYNLQQYMKSSTKTQEVSGTLEELLDMYCARDKSADYTKVLADLLRDIGVDERVHMCLCERLSS